MAARTIKTRILIISDTHCATLDGAPGSGFKRPLPRADLLIHCGDLTYTGTEEQYHKSLDLLSEIEAPVKLVIAGNHDRTLDREYVHAHLRTCGPTKGAAEERYQEMRRIWTARDGRARQEGVTFLDEGIHEIDLANGASVKMYTSEYTPEFWDWGFPYERYEDRFNLPAASLSDAKNITLNPIPAFTAAERPLDVLVTHGPPFGRLDETERGEKVGCPHSLRALMGARPLLHCFGHIHEARGAETVRWDEKADVVLAESMSTKTWTEGGCERGVKDVKEEKQEWGFEEDMFENAAFLDVSRLKRGEETLLVNASIMNLRYRPTNPAWLVDLELPASTKKSERRVPLLFEEKGRDLPKG